MSTLWYPFYYYFFLCTNSHLPNLSPLHCGRQPPQLPRSAAEMLYTICRVKHCCRYCYPVSDILGGLLIRWTLYYMIWRRSHQIRRCRSVNRDTVGVFPPVMPDLVLPHIYHHRPHRNAYLLPYLSSSLSSRITFFSSSCLSATSLLMLSQLRYLC